MNKSDLRGLDKIIKEQNAIVKIAMDRKRLVRKMIINLEEGKDIVYTGASLKKLLRNASKLLALNEIEKQVCIGGIPMFDSELDDCLRDYHFLIYRDQVQNLFKMHIAPNSQGSLILISWEVPFKDGVYGLMAKAEEALKQESKKID